MTGLALRLCVFALASCVTASSCSVYHEPLLAGAKTGSRDDPSDTKPDKPDAASDPGSPTDTNQACGRGRCWWSQERPDDDCQSSGAPSPSERPNDDGGSSLKDLYLGWFHTQLGESTTDADGKKLTWQKYGFDLDGTCTNAATCRSMQDKVSCKGSTARIPFDGELCRDNSFGSLQAIAAAMPEVGERFGLNQQRVNCGLWRGDFSIVMRLSGYNGKPNDSKVRLDLYAATGLQMLPPWTCPQEDFSTRYPHWRQSAPWHIDSAALSGAVEQSGQLPNSNVHDDNAYVRDGYLVASFPKDVALRFMGDREMYRGFAFTLHRSIWTGRLSRSQDSTWQISDGLIGGRIRKRDLVRTFREQGLCEGPLYNDLLGYIEESVDILADGEDPEQACDAISFAIGYDAAAMTPGAAASVPPFVECCPPERPLAECDADCGDGKITGTELCDVSITDKSGGACPSECPSEDPCVRRSVSGADCMKECTDTPITEVGPSDKCCPSGANATVDKDCSSTCGNQIIEPGETCDPPGSCAACATEDKCLSVSTTGSAESCNTTCKLTALTNCRNGDACCPSGCNPMNDSDCSATCGNNTLEPNETCERDASPRCPANCDDGDVCTNDVQTGSPMTCNVRCTHLKITEPRGEDGCCPPGATANTDSDCVAACGNGKLEGQEQCDDGNVHAGDACSPQCKQETPNERCAALWKPQSEACAKCACESCAVEVVSCITAADENARNLCTKVLDCAARSHCFGQECFCGSSDTVECGRGEAKGPCKAEIEQAAGTTDPAIIRILSLDPTTPLGMALTPRFCFDAFCRSCTGAN